MNKLLKYFLAISLVGCVQYADDDSLPLTGVIGYEGTAYVSSMDEDSGKVSWLPGAGISISYGSSGTVTDMEGKYDLSVPIEQNSAVNLLTARIDDSRIVRTIRYEDENSWTITDLYLGRTVALDIYTTSSADSVFCTLVNEDEIIEDIVYRFYQNPAGKLAAMELNQGELPIQTVIPFDPIPEYQVEILSFKDAEVDTIRLQLELDLSTSSFISLE